MMHVESQNVHQSSQMGHYVLVKHRSQSKKDESQCLCTLKKNSLSSQMGHHVLVKHIGNLDEIVSI